MIALGGVALLATMIGSVAIPVIAVLLLIEGRRRPVARMLAGWGTYLLAYVLISTALAVLQRERVFAVGQEFCADSGCFAVDKVDRVVTAPQAEYTVSWHLASNDPKRSKHFPGGALEVYLFDERGRRFMLPQQANQTPFDVTLPAGETVRDSMNFTVPDDAHQLLLTAKYRSFSFQSFLPGELSLVPHRPRWMVRIQ